MFYRLVRFLPAKLEFMNSYKYNNLMFGLLAYAAEKMTGKTWEESLRENLLEPLGMGAVEFSHLIGEDKDRAVGYMQHGTDITPVPHEYHR